MEISAKVLREVEFRDRLRGYDTDEVDEFLEEVAVAVEELQRPLLSNTRGLTRSVQRLRLPRRPPLQHPIQSHIGWRPRWRSGLNRVPPRMTSSLLSRKISIPSP